MFYVRSTKDTRRGRPISARAARWLSALALLAYPPGAFLAGCRGHVAAQVAGAVLLIAALVAAASLANTSVQRIVGEVPAHLDEFEMQLRLRAIQSAYMTFTLLALGLVLYAAMAIDTRLWVPRSYAGFDGLFWGVFLYAWILPSAFVAWRMEDGEADDGDGR